MLFFRVTMLVILTLMLNAVAYSQVSVGSLPILEPVLNEIVIDCDHDVVLASSALNQSGLFGFQGRFSDCVPFDGEGQSTLSYTLNNVAAVRAIRSGMNSSSSFSYAFQWEIEGGHFIVGENGSSESICDGDSNSPSSVGICYESGFTDVEFGLNDSYARSTVRVQWDNEATDVKPKVKVKLLIERSSKIDLIKFKVDGFGVKVTGKNKRKYTICEKEFKLGSDIYNVNEITTTYSCNGNGSRAFVIDNDPYQEGCLVNNFGIDDVDVHAFQFRIGQGAWSAEQFARDNRFVVDNVGTMDAVFVRVTPVFLNGYRGIEFTGRAAPETQAFVTIPDEICGNRIFTAPWQVRGLNFVDWNFSPNFPTSIVSISGNTLSFNQLPPNGRYGVYVMGTDACGDPVEVRRFFDVVTCGNDVPIPLTAPETEQNDVVMKMESDYDDVSIDLVPSSVKVNYNTAEKTSDRGRGFSNEFNLSKEEVFGKQFKVYPTLVERLQPVKVKFENKAAELGGRITISVIDVTGQELYHVVTAPGDYDVDIQTDNMGPGLYFLRVVAADKLTVKNVRFIIK